MQTVSTRKKPTTARVSLERIRKQIAKNPVDVVRKGVPFSLMSKITRAFGLPTEAVPQLLRISDRTLARRKKNPEPFTSEQTERLIRLVRIMDLAIEVLEDRDKARSWVFRPNVGLNGERPFDMLDTGVGYEQARDILQRMEFGVYS